MALKNKNDGRIFLLAIHPLFFKTTQSVAERLVVEGIKIIHPPTIDTFIESVTPHDTIVTLYFTEDTLFRNKMAKLEQQGATMIDSSSKMQLTENRVKTFKLLQKHGIKVPHYFFGSPEKIPFALGRKLVRKNPLGHDVSLVDKKSLTNSNSQEIYVEQYVPNKENIVRCVMYVFGKIYTRIKQDRFSKITEALSGLEPIVPPTQFEIDLAQSIHKNTKMQLFNIDTIEDIVIEINCCPNFFSYEPAILHFIKELKKTLTKKDTQT